MTVCCVSEDNDDDWTQYPDEEMHLILITQTDKKDQWATRLAIYLGNTEGNSLDSRSRNVMCGDAGLKCFMDALTIEK